MIIYRILTIILAISVISYVIFRRKHNLKEIIISTIIVLLFYTTLEYLSIDIIPMKIQRLEVFIYEFRTLGQLTDLMLLTYSIILSIINILISPIVSTSTSIAGSIYLVYTSIFSRMFSTLETSLFIISNIAQLGMLLFTSISDIVEISKILLNISRAVLPLIFVKKLRTIVLIIVISTIVIALTSVMLLNSTNLINTASVNSNQRISELLENVSNEYNNVALRNYTMISIVSRYPLITILNIRCSNLSITIYGIGDFQNIVPCRSPRISVRAIFFDISKITYECKRNYIRNMRLISCTIKVPGNINPINIGRYYVGYYVSNCSNIILSIYRDHIYIHNLSPFRCIINVYAPTYNVARHFSAIYIKAISSMLRFLRLYKGKSIKGFEIKLEHLYDTFQNIKYYNHIVLSLGNYSETEISVNNHSYVLWPIDISHISYNDWLYRNYNRMKELSTLMFSLGLIKFLRRKFNIIILSSIYSIVLDVLGFVALFCTIVNTSSIENLFYKMFIRISRSILYDFILVFYFRIVSQVISRRVLKRIFSVFKSKGTVVLVDYDNNVRSKYSLKVRNFIRKRYVSSDYMFRKSRDAVLKAVDKRIVREIERSRVPALRISRGRRAINIIVEDLIKNLYGKSLSDLKSFNLRSDKRLLFLVSSLYRRYDNIIDLSIDVRLTPTQLVVLSLRRDVLIKLCRDSDYISDKVKRILEADRKVIEREFRKYIRDLYQISIVLSSRIYRKVDTNILMSIDSISRDVDRSLVFKWVRNTINYYLDRDFVNVLLSRYVRILRDVYRDREDIINRELMKVRYLRRLFR